MLATRWYRACTVPAALIAGAVSAFAVIGSVQLARSGEPKAAPKRNTLILALMPPRQVGAFVCYRATLAGGRAMDIEDWSGAQLVPLERLSPDGKPYMRNVPAMLKDQRVRSFLLSLTHDDRTSSYDWIYNFRLQAEVDGLGKLLAFGECPYFSGKKYDPHNKTYYTANTTTLHCGIDCDGGEFALERVAGSKDMTIAFSARLGLRMKRGCGGGGSYGLASDLTVRLEKVDPAACAELSKADH